MGKMAKAFVTGLGLALAATAGAFLLYKKNPKVRRKTQVWAENMKREIKTTLSELKEVNQVNFKKTVDQVGERYSRMKEVNKGELAGLLSDLKESWGHFSKDLSTLKKD
jgi:hypothetical protein